MKMDRRRACHLWNALTSEAVGQDAEKVLPLGYIAMTNNIQMAIQYGTGSAYEEERNKAAAFLREWAESIDDKTAIIERMIVQRTTMQIEKLVEYILKNAMDACMNSGSIACPICQTSILEYNLGTTGRIYARCSDEKCIRIRL